MEAQVDVEILKLKLKPCKKENTWKIYNTTSHTFVTITSHASIARLDILSNKSYFDRHYAKVITFKKRRRKNYRQAKE